MSVDCGDDSNEGVVGDRLYSRPRTVCRRLKYRRGVAPNGTSSLSNCMSSERTRIGDHFTELVARNPVLACPSAHSLTKWRFMGEKGEVNVRVELILEEDGRRPNQAGIRKRGRRPNPPGSTGSRFPFFLGHPFRGNS